MRHFLVSRYDGQLHSVRAFPEAAKRTAEREAGVLEGIGYATKVFQATDLAELVAAEPDWFTERPQTSPHPRKTNHAAA